MYSLLTNSGPYRVRPAYRIVPVLRSTTSLSIRETVPCAPRLPRSQSRADPFTFHLRRGHSI